MIYSFQEELFYEVLWTAWNASWCACNSRPLWNRNKFESEKDEKAFYAHAVKMLQKGIEIGLSEDVLNNIKWGAWNAAWRAANTKSINLWGARQDKKRWNEHFQEVLNSRELDEKLVHHIKYMCSDIGFYCAHMRITRSEKDQIQMANRAINHCLEMCPDMKEDKLRRELGLAEVALEIQKRLRQLKQINPDATLEQQKAYVDATIPPTIKKRLIGALQAGSETAIEEFLDNPYITVGIAIVKGWLYP